jgi:hypothetical protein
MTDCDTSMKESWLRDFAALTQTALIFNSLLSSDCFLLTASCVLFPSVARLIQRGDLGPFAIERQFLAIQRKQTFAQAHRLL